MRSGPVGGGRERGGLLSKIYVVAGSTGEYSDHREWVVCYFVDEAKAQKVVELLSALTRLHRVDYQDSGVLEADYKARRQAEEAIKKFDPYFQVDYTGTNYMIWEVDPGDDLLLRLSEPAATPGGKE